jgi:hypothetical protein
MSPLIGFSGDMTTGFSGTGFSLGGVVDPEAANTTVKVVNTSRDRTNIFFIDIYYTLLTIFIVQITKNCQNNCGVTRSTIYLY